MKIYGDYLTRVQTVTASWENGALHKEECLFVVKREDSLVQY